MPYSDKFKQLKAEYCMDRSLEIDDDQFAALIYTFPSVLIANSDGKIDENEEDFIEQLPITLTTDFGTEEYDHIASTTLNKAYFTEVKHLLKNLERWEKPFLNTLKDQLHGSMNERNAIFEMMWRTADSSKDISEEERKKIDDISSVLGL